ncbi:SDR family NAD(P)-dependent oxidoreductase [Amorphus orientalis]|uniref:NAD(P)-dependent dehydrogenase (Short-subunit alcohol dehydrogenase family) n=1 Tax=Amorphus orientalis TaxID=649198 RepID=A0AAE4ASE6_9HYPH|nr:SDR family NAD(P)-dependent oxidoreductase [Amorphus orientalis]MDQ0315042.1 NAD(P)-dependent dehydrogenase (short-subunit alcohol dehydrogenase family) [Amorphus orientalis]
MDIQAGMAAYVSGAGSGIGRGIARVLASRGVRVGVADIRGEAAEETVALIAADGGQAVALEVDVSEKASVEAAADAIEGAFGPVSIVCNNAGVAMHGVPVHEFSSAEWDWVIGVNLYGVIHGIQTFVPRLIAAGGPGHVVNTASIGGFQVNAAFLTGPYSTTKYAVVALSEALSNELAETSIGVSILAPAAVNTSIHLSERSRPDRLGGAYVRPENHFMGELIRDGADPLEIGRQVAEAIEDDALYVFTHPETEAWLEARCGRILAGYDRLKGDRSGARQAAE